MKSVSRRRAMQSSVANYSGSLASQNVYANYSVTLQLASIFASAYVANKTFARLTGYRFLNKVNVS